MFKLVRWTPRTVETRQPTRTLDQMIDELLWQDVGGATPFLTDTAQLCCAPALDVVENEANITIQANLPGVSPENIKVEVEGDLLTISGEINQTAGQEGEHYHYRERYTGAFKRSLRLADTLDAQNIEARFENGVLTLVLPKLPAAQPKTDRHSGGIRYGLRPLHGFIALFPLPHEEGRGEALFPLPLYGGGAGNRRLHGWGKTKWDNYFLGMA